MYSIGIFATTKSLKNIMNIDQEMRQLCNVTYLPYTSPEHLEFLYQQNMDRFDGFLFGGSYPYEVLCSVYGKMSKPYAYFNISDRDYYKIIASLLFQEPNMDFSRVYFDVPDTPVDFQAVFGREGMPFLGEAPIDWDHVNPYDWYQPLKDYYLQLWNSGRVDLLVIRFGSLDDFLDRHQIRHIYLAPSSESMLETFRGLMMQLDAVSIHDSAASIGLVGSSRQLTDKQWKALGDRLQACNKCFGKPFLIYEHGDHYEITTNISQLKELSQQYTTCPITTFLDRGLSYPVCVAWGCANNVVDAHRNAQRAMKEAVLCKESAAFIVLGNNVIIGPLSTARRLSYPDQPGQKLEQLGGQLSIPHHYFGKIASVLAQKGEDTLTAKEMADYLDITPRSAARILAKLELGGLAILQKSRQLNTRGRPQKIYKINLQELP